MEVGQRVRVECEDGRKVRGVVESVNRGVVCVVVRSRDGKREQRVMVSEHDCE